MAGGKPNETAAVVATSISLLCTALLVSCSLVDVTRHDGNRKARIRMKQLGIYAGGLLAWPLAWKAVSTSRGEVPRGAVVGLMWTIALLGVELNMTHHGRALRSGVPAIYPTPRGDASMFGGFALTIAGLMATRCSAGVSSGASPCLIVAFAIGVGVVLPQVSTSKSEEDDAAVATVRLVALDYAIGLVISGLAVVLAAVADEP